MINGGEREKARRFISGRFPPMEKRATECVLGTRNANLLKDYGGGGLCEV